MASRRNCIYLTALIGVAAWLPLNGQSGQAPPAAVSAGVPSDLRPLLVPRHSEMRLVSQSTPPIAPCCRATTWVADAAAAVAAHLSASDAGPAPSISPNRLARLKRFDVDWQAALDKVDASKPVGRRESGPRRAQETHPHEWRAARCGRGNDRRLSPLLPFSPASRLVNESRVRMEDVDSQKAAGELTAITKEIQQVRAKLESGLGGAAPKSHGPTAKQPSPPPPRWICSTAASRIGSTSSNGYDPLFTWWMGLPFKHVDGALRDTRRSCATRLRRRISRDIRTTGRHIGRSRAGGQVRVRSRSRGDPRAPAGRDDRHRPGIRGAPGGGRGGRGDAPEARPPSFYQEWLAALKTLDFEKLTRNAQVDYLFIKRTSGRSDRAREDSRSNRDSAKDGRDRHHG